MTSLHIVANILGKFWVGLCALLFIPIYLRLLGIEAYGLVGFFSLLLALSTLLDGGMPWAVNREMARLSAQSASAQETCNFLRTLEIVYWTMAFAVGVLICLGSNFLTEKWFSHPTLASSSINHSICLMSIALLFQLPFSLYSNGLLGMQQHVRLNLLVIGCATLRGLGAIVILTFISPTIEAFFLWQVSMSALQSASAAYLLWACMPKATQPSRFEVCHLKRIGRFCAEISGISIFSFVLLQIDKMVLSHVLSMEKFGYYCLAASLAGGLSCISMPISATFFPKFSKCVALDDTHELSRIYHQSCQIIAVLLLPVALLLALFSSQILLFWTNDSATASEAEGVLKWMALGTACNGLIALPCALQLAFQWTRLLFYQNLITAIIAIPLLLWATQTYGGIGAAMVWLTQNIAYIALVTPFMHRKLLKGEMGIWFRQDVAMPLCGALGGALLAKWALTPLMTDKWSTAVLGVLATALCMLAAFLMTPLAKPHIRKMKLRKRSL
jgi:O-antigen/teichoic acid export membrane protein